MARESVLAAGGIVLRREQPPLVAVVRLRKRDEWVLPKGKLNDGETPRTAARREVLEETGHNVTVHEFLGTLVYESGGRSKVVHYWRMEAGGEQMHELMNDVRAVDWLPLDAAVARLSRGYERAFLENVGPIAVTVLAKKLKGKAAPTVNRAAAPPLNKPAPAPAKAAPTPTKAAPTPTKAAPTPTKPAPAPKKRRIRVPVPPELPLAVQQPALVVPPVTLEESPVHVSDVVMEEAPILDADPSIPETVIAEPELEPALVLEEPPVAMAELVQEDGAIDQADGERPSLAQKVRSWLGRAA
jgi:8-oxo-dGTP diphosphatase